MKKLLLVVMLSVITLTCFTNNISANEKSSFDAKEEIVVSVNSVKLDNGLIKETIIYELVDVSSSRNISASKTGTKTVNFKNSSNQTLWSVSVTGTFLYDQVTVSCTSSKVSTSVYDSSWKISSSSATKTSNSATATATAKLYTLGVVVQTVTESVTLKCSRTGVLS